MIPSTVAYYRAISVNDAIQKLKENPDAKLLAGGHSLIPAMKLRLNSPELVIDVANIESLKNISEADGILKIGSMVTHADIVSSTLIQKSLPLFSQTADLIGDVQVRNMGTIGGSIAHADPSADWPAALLASEATVVVQRGAEEVKITSEDFFQGFFSTALEDGDIITRIEVSVPVHGAKMAYQKFMQPASRFAIVGCAVILTKKGNEITDAKVAFTGVSDGPFRDRAIEKALIGEAVSAESIENASQLAASEADSIMEDHYASEEYRRHLAKVFAKKALLAAADI